MPSHNTEDILLHLDLLLHYLQESKHGASLNVYQEMNV